MEIETNTMIPKDVALSVAMPKPYEDPIAFETRVAEKLADREREQVMEAARSVPSGLVPPEIAQMDGGVFRMGENATMAAVMAADMHRAIDGLKPARPGEAQEIVNIAALEAGNKTAPTRENHVTWGGR